MKALLLAAGIGERLRPVTNFVPKCLVPINGKPLLKYWLDNMISIGIKDILVNMHYKAEMVKAFIKNYKHKHYVTLKYEEELLLTGGTLLENKSFFDGDDILLAHADNLCICDFTAFANAYYTRANSVDMTMMTFRSDHPETCGIVELKENIVIGFYEKIKSPPTNLANGAVYIMSPKVLNYLKEMGKKKIDFSTEVIPHFIGRMNVFHNDVYHRDIGTVESYALAQIESEKFL